MKLRHFLMLAACCVAMVCISVPTVLAESTSPIPDTKAGLAPPWLLPSASASNLKSQPLPNPRKPIEAPWFLQMVGSVVLYSAEQYAKKQLDDGRPPLPYKDYANYFYPLPQRIQPPPESQP